MTSRGARAGRGATIAAFATFVASLAHTVGGGAPPGPLAVLLALAFSLPLAMLLAGARAQLLRTSISALVAQSALHVCYALGGASVAAPAVTSSHIGHATAGQSAAAQLDAITALPIVDHGHALMPLAHLMAAVLTIAALALGDATFDALRRSVLIFVRRLVSTPAPTLVAPARIAARADHTQLIGAVLPASISSRGPPVVAAAR
ncbi:hypothetical protein ACFWN7_15370 [Agromyces sp. NPDC058484]|uniref:hypothetical protein n=1 Tax=Agromyces sp. NPDC058484 TaxID=3346524 RepID=UPI003657A5B7